MTKNLEWKPDTRRPTGKGATKHRFTANDGKEELEIEVAPWGEGDLRADGADVAHVDTATSGGDGFRQLDHLVEEYEEARDAFADLPRNIDEETAKDTK